MQPSDNQSMMASDTISVTITEEVATREDTDPLELPPIHRRIDTDALARLCTTPTGESVTVEFSYCGYTVRANGTGQVHLLDDES